MSSKLQFITVDGIFHNSNAATMLRYACQHGLWAIIQNCHLVAQWSLELLDIFHVRNITKIVSVRVCVYIYAYLRTPGTLTFDGEVSYSPVIYQHCSEIGHTVSPNDFPILSPSRSTKKL